jgi:glutaredoxin
MRVTIYSTTTCTFCGALCAWLDTHNIPYDYKVTDTDPSVMKEYIEISNGVIGVPFTVVDNGGGRISKILGFDKPKLQAALGL